MTTSSCVLNRTLVLMFTVGSSCPCIQNPAVLFTWHAQILQKYILKETASFKAFMHALFASHSHLLNSIGAPIWSDYPFLEVESSPVSAVLDLPTLDKSVISRLSYYTVLSRQRRGSGTWSRWSKKDGLVRPSQERMEIDGLLASANVQIIVTAHLQDPFTGAVAMANSSILSISLPEASEFGTFHGPN